MQSKGYNVTVTQIENKLKSLERAYKNMITSNKQTGRGRMSCAYQTELTEILAHKHNIEHLAMSGKHGLILREHLPASTLGSQNTINAQPSTSNSNLDEPSTSKCSDSNNSNPSHVNKISRKHMGATSRLLQTCHHALENISTHIQQENAVRRNTQKEILAEYKEMRNAYTESLNNINEQLKRANVLRENKNKLLEGLLKELKRD